MISLRRKREVRSQFGTGKGDFKAVFAKLKSIGFNCPIMVEDIQVGPTAGKTPVNVRAHREFLEKALGSS
jgi:sugar phosphate isomerase/epimerase